MANVNSISTSSSGSLYGSRNVLSGLASGMDTEAMIENSISGYKAKVTKLEQDKTSLEWKQTAMQSLTDQAADALSKYTSYSGQYGLGASTYYKDIQTTAVSGSNAKAVSAAGQTNSNVIIKSAQTATGAGISVDQNGQSLLSRYIQSGTGGYSLKDVTLADMGLGSGLDLGALHLDASTNLQDLVSQINERSDEYTASFSSETGQFKIMSKELGSASSLGGIENNALFQTSGQSVALDTVLGSDFGWDRSGNAIIRDSQGNTLGMFNRNDSVESLVNAFNNAGGVTQSSGWMTSTYKLQFGGDGFSFYRESGITYGSSAPSLSNFTFSNVSGSKSTGFDVVSEAAKAAAGSGSGAYTITRGTDAKMLLEIDGVTKMVSSGDAAETEFGDLKASLTQDGKLTVGSLNVEMKKSFAAADAEDYVTISTKADADKQVDAVKAFVADMNSLLKNLHDAYSTQPLKRSNGEKYKPLTEEDQDDMSETAIEKYEAKAKTGLLFGDSDVSGMYNKLLNAVSPGGELQKKMSDIGITLNYESGVSSLALDENKLRSALEQDNNAVKNVFADSTDSDGNVTAGVMSKANGVLKMYANSSMGDPGILVKKAGTNRSSTSLLDNELHNQIQKVQEQIDSWRTKMSDKVDYYTQQFSLLEQLVQKMNSQSGMFSGMMGG